MSNLLISEPPLTVLPSLAERIGLDEAIVLQQVHYLTSSSERVENTKAFKEGFYWVFHTVENWRAKFFRWWSAPTVKRVFQTLTSSGLLLTDTFDEGQGHRRLWYRVNYALVEAIAKIPADKWDVKRDDRIILIQSFLSDQNDPNLRDQNDPNLRDQNDPNLRDQNDPNTIYKNSSKKEFLIDKKEIPPTPQKGDVCVDGEKSISSLEPQPEKPSLPTKAEIETQAQPEHTSSSSIVPAGSFDQIEQWNKVTDEQKKEWFLQVYQAEKPSNFTEHRGISSTQLRKINALCKEYPADALAKFRDALTWVREQNDGWWRDKPISLDNLVSNGKIAEYADKHATAMKHDRAYRDRVEGRSPSKDLKRIIPDTNISQSQYEEAYETECRRQELIDVYDYRPVLAKLKRF
ncbi:hypothetical protein H6G36_25405 [Anabaena minutissima FACHB-250]|nr:hypothetical protein [Anabaena minutissima FACHB-250]